MHIDKVLKFLRVAHNLKQKDVASNIGFSRSHISELEKGKKKPSLEVTEAYARFFKIPHWEIWAMAEGLACKMNPVTKDPDLIKAWSVYNRSAKTN